MTADFKAKKLTENVQENDTEVNEIKHKVSYTTYNERYEIDEHYGWLCLIEKTSGFFI